MANDRKEEAWQLIHKAAHMNRKPLAKDLEMWQVHLKVLFLHKWTIYMLFCMCTVALRCAIHIVKIVIR